MNCYSLPKKKVHICVDNSYLYYQQSTHRFEEDTLSDERADGGQVHHASMQTGLYEYNRLTLALHPFINQ